jgi:multiple sugar transport system permease protein
VIAAFPLFWITMMSLKLPVDAFSENPLVVLLGPSTREAGPSVSAADLLLGGAFIWALRRSFQRLPQVVVSTGLHPLLCGAAWLCGGLLLATLLPSIARGLDFIPLLNTPLLGITLENFRAVWVEQEFTRQFLNSLLVTGGVVSISLTVGTLAGYGIARAGSSLAFWLLMVALVFRALPHSVLVSGYLPVFINSAELLRPLLGDAAPVLYGKPWAIIIVLASINQPFTIWMLRSFFQNIPRELDEAARVDGCSHIGAFVRVIMPVMWPGVITAGLFSFLLAYNDYLVAALLLDIQNQTMVPAISGFFNRETTATDQVEAVAAAVSITAPLFLLVMMFQKQLVSGLTQGAVKG